jgi:hypothetical protein
LHRPHDRDRDAADPNLERAEEGDLGSRLLHAFSSRTYQGFLALTRVEPTVSAR